jgi:hypothetical protein
LSRASDTAPSSSHGAPALDWYRSSQRTLRARESFALFLLQLDALPFLGANMPNIGPGCRSHGLESDGKRFGLVYQVIPAENAIRIISIVAIP